MKYIRNFFTTSCWYILTISHKQNCQPRDGIMKAIQNHGSTMKSNHYLGFFSLSHRVSHLLNKLTKSGPYFAILFDEAISRRDFLNSERFFVTICVLGVYVFMRLFAISKVLISACQSAFLTLSSRQFDVVISVVSSCHLSEMIASSN